MWECCYNLPAAIPAIASTTAVDFAELREVHILPEVLPHRANISVVLIRRDLIAAIGTHSQVGDECVGADARATANVVRDDEFAFAVERKPQHRATPFVGVAFVKVRFPRVDVGPHLIDLYVPGANVAHSGIEQLPRPLRCRIHERQNRVLVKSGESRDRADAHALKHHCESFGGNIRRGVVGSELWFVLGERDLASSAAVSLDSALAVSSEFTNDVITTLACHLSLDFLLAIGSK